MKNTTKLLLILSVFAIAFSSCSKEKKLTRNITKDGGEWRIVRHTKKEYFHGAPEPGKSYVLAENQGSFVFDDNGDVAYTFYFAYTESMMTIRGTWWNTEDELTTSMAGEQFVYKIVAQSKKGLTLESEILYDLGDRTVFNLVLEKM